MAENMDRFLGRRTSWDGVVVRDLSDPTSSTYGLYYRVAWSARDPRTGAWEIRWRSDADLIGTTAPSGVAVYKFDGTTWDLPAYAATVVPIAAIGWYLVAGVIGTVVAALIWEGADADVPVVLLWAMMLCGMLTAWFTAVEPVRGTKFVIAANVWLAVHNARMTKVLADQVEEANQRYRDGVARFEAERERAHQAWLSQRR